MTRASLAFRIIIFVLIPFPGCSTSLCGLRPIPESSAVSTLKTGDILWKIQEGLPLPQPKFALFDPGSPEVIDYRQYGEIRGAGTTEYRYVINKAEQLKKAIGEGIYPNEMGVYKDPIFLKYKEQNALGGSHWDYLSSPDYLKAFYVWAKTNEEKGVKTYFTARILEKAGLLIPALKAYYAALIHFPKSACWSADNKFVWYIAPAAIADIKRLCRDYPQLNLEFVEASFTLQNGNDTNLANDIITINPGYFVKKTLAQKRQSMNELKALSITETRGEGKVQLVKFQNGHWQLRIDGRPFFVRGVTYLPTEIGLGTSDPHFDSRWMFLDKNNNGKIDVLSDVWIDKNNNGQRDANEPLVSDFQLMKDIGINAIRMYIPNKTISGYDPSLVNKPLLREMHKKYGIWVIAGDFLGAYTLGSGASWQTGTDYTNPQERQSMLETVRAKVMDLKDEPFILMWLLGNENNMAADYTGVNATRTKATVHPEAYAQFLQEVAQLIHELDPDHPVAIGNIETNLLEEYKQFAPAIDVLGINSYRGAQGFGDLWENVKNKFDRPILITEYGCDAYAQGKGPDEDGQLEYHRGNFRDIVFNKAGGPGAGNAIGGVIFEYLDEWWKDTRNDPNDQQQTNATFAFPFPDGFSHEEWLGIVSQGKGQNSPFERHLRKTYFYYKEMTLP